MNIPDIANLLDAPERTIYQIYFKKQYVELTENMIFKRRKLGSSKLNLDQVKEIVSRLKRNECQSDIALAYNVGVSTIDDIRHHRTWTEVTNGIEFDPIKKIFGNCKKAVVQYDADGKYIETYESARDAEKKTGIGYKLISRVCNGKRYLTYGFHFEFANTQ